MSPPDFTQNPKYLPPKPGEPALHGAARTGDHEAIGRLIAGGADVNQPFNVALDPGGRQMLATPLMVAAGSGEGAGVETMHLLLRMGADSSFVSEPGSIARYAAAGLGWNYKPGGDALRLQLCLKLGCDPNEVDPRGVTLLADAATTGDVSRVQVLLDAGASPNADSSVVRSNFSPMADSPFDEDASYSFRIPLHNAVDAAEFEMVRLILAAGADVHAMDSSRQTALFQARSPRVAQQLIDTGFECGSAG